MAVPGRCLTIVPLNEPTPDPHLQVCVQAGFSLFPSPKRCPEPGLPQCPWLPAPDWGGGTFFSVIEVEIMTSLACQLISSVHNLNFMSPLLG